MQAAKTALATSKCSYRIIHSAQNFVVKVFLLTLINLLVNFKIFTDVKIL